MFIKESPSCCGHNSPVCVYVCACGGHFVSPKLEDAFIIVLHLRKEYMSVPTEEGSNFNWMEKEECKVFECVAVCWNMLQYVAVCRSVLEEE